MPTRRGTSRTALGWTCACTSRTTRADLASPTKPSQGMQHHTPPKPGLLPSWAPCLPCSTGLAAGQRSPGSSHLGCPPSLPAKTSARGTATVLRQHRSPAAAQPAPPSAGGSAAATRAQTSSLSPQAPRTTAAANSFCRSSTASTRNSSGVRFPTRRLPALRTISPLGPAHSVATPSHLAAHQAMAPVQCLAPAIRWYAV
jgi:hypothetical protein